MHNRWILYLLVILLAPDVGAAGALGPDVEFDCPCGLASNSSTSITMTLGVNNIGSGASGELIVRAYAHTGYSYNDSFETAQYLGEITGDHLRPSCGV